MTSQMALNMSVGKHNKQNKLADQSKLSSLLAGIVASGVSKVGGISLGGGIKTLGDGVKTSAGSKGNSGISIGDWGGIRVGSIESISISFSISRPLAKVVSIESRVSIEGGISLGGSIKSLGDGVKTSAGAKGNSGISNRGSVRVSSIESISISRPLANVVSIVSSK